MSSKRPQSAAKAQAVSKITADVSGLDAANPILRHIAQELGTNKSFISFSLHIKFANPLEREEVIKGTGG